jgi:hypothetical protein
MVCSQREALNTDMKSQPQLAVLTCRSLLLEICSFLGGRRGAAWRPEHGDLAARNGNLSLMQDRLLQGKPFSFSTAAMDEAAARNELATVRWLSANSSAGCTVAAVNTAAVRGHYQMVALLTALGAPASVWAMDGAAAQGDLPMLQLLGSLRSEGCTSRAHNSAAVRGRLDILTWLGNNCADSSSEPSEWAITGAAMRGHVHILAWITARYPALQCTTDAIDLAAIAGQEQAVRWLNEHRSEGYTLWGLDSAREQQYSSIVQYLEADAASARSHCKKAIAAADSSAADDCESDCEDNDDDEPEESVAVAELHELVCC